MPGPARAGGGFASPVLFITGRDAASAHERDNPGNNMRTLSLSRTLGAERSGSTAPWAAGGKERWPRSATRPFGRLSDNGLDHAGLFVSALCLGRCSR